MEKATIDGYLTKSMHYSAQDKGITFNHLLQVYGDENYQKAAERAGETVWAEGLLRKGPGLCHGVAGNAYALLALHKALGGANWLHRALEFARYLCFGPYPL